MLSAWCAALGAAPWATAWAIRSLRDSGALAAQPVLVRLRGLDDDTGGHQTVADAANLRALDVEGPGERRLEPAGDGPAGHGVLLEPEHGHREAVEHIPRGEVEVVDRVHLDVQLIHGPDVVLGIELPVRPRV